MTKADRGPVLIRPGETADVDAMVQIENAAFPTDRLNHKAMRRSLRSPTISVLTAVQDGAPVGYALLHRRRRSSVVQLASIAVAASAAGQGLGKRLLEAAEREAAQHGGRRLRLEVRPDNKGALALYESAGFRRFDVIAEYYSDGTSAWCYEKALGQ